MTARNKKNRFAHESVMGKKTGNLPISEQIGVKSEGFYADLQPLHSILKERDNASAELAGYLKELGYERKTACV